MSLTDRMVPTRGEVLEILNHPSRHEWTMQGFGMLRMYLSDEIRIQVWDQRLAVPGSANVHDHPWHFTSTIMAGVLYNQRFSRSDSWLEPEYNQVLIRPGEQGGPIEEATKVHLHPMPVEVYGMGESYDQEAEELHVTRYQQGTVTVIVRERVRERDVAYSLWQGERPWGSAEPCRASDWQVRRVIEDSLSTWWRLL